jgi:hypothetical protein
LDPSSDELPPFVENQDPAPAAVDAAVDDDVLLTVTDLFEEVNSGVDLTSTLVEIEINAGGFVAAYNGGSGGFQPGFSGTVTDETDEGLSYNFVIEHADWPAGAHIAVRVTTQDTSPNENQSVTTYEFDVAEAVITDLVVQPSSASLDGGAAVFFGAADLDDPSENRTFVGTTAPGGWVPSTTGSGALSYGINGVLMRTGAARGSTAALARSTAFANFDVRVGVAINNAAGGRVQLIATCDEGTATVELAVGTSAVLGRGAVACSGQTVQGGAHPATRSTTLRLVRYGRLVWGFVGDRIVFATDVFGTTDATWTLRVENGDRAVDIAATWLSFSVQSAGSINERLLIDSETRFGQVVGSIPAAPLREVGVARAAVFGLFGAVERWWS